MWNIAMQKSFASSLSEVRANMYFTANVNIDGFEISQIAQFSYLFLNATIVGFNYFLFAN